MRVLDSRALRRSPTQVGGRTHTDQPAKRHDGTCGTMPEAGGPCPRHGPAGWLEVTEEGTMTARSIIVGYDGSRGAREAMWWALTEGNRSGRPVQLLYALGLRTLTRLRSVRRNGPGWTTCSPSGGRSIPISS